MSFAFSYPIIFCAYCLSMSMSRDNRCALPGIKFRKTNTRTCFELTLTCLVLVRLIFSRKKRCILWPFKLKSDLFLLEITYVTGEIFAHLSGIMWIKCRQSGKCPVCGDRKLCKEYSRPPSKFSVFEDSALDCESKLLLARQVRKYISLLLPHHLHCKPSAK